MADPTQTSTPAGEQSQQGVDNSAAPANAPGAGERVAFMEKPEWVPDQFYKDGHVDFKAMAGSYSDLRTKMDSGAPSKSEANQQPAASKSEANPLQAEQITIPGVSHDAMQKYTQQVQGEGLTQESYSELAKLGYPKRVVDAYVTGLKPVDENAVGTKAVERQKFIDETINGIGGQSVLTDMVNWATNNLNEADLKVYNEAVSSNDPARVKQAVNGLFHAYSQEVGVEPKQIDGNRSSDIGGLKPFYSNEEVVDAMANPKYARDPAYRAEVEARLAVSNVFGQSVDVQLMKDPEKRVFRYQS